MPPSRTLPTYPRPSWLRRFFDCPIFDWLLALFIALIATVAVVKPEPTFKTAINTALATMGVQYRTVQAQGFTMRFYESGMDNEKTVVLLHGLGGNALYTWMRLMPALAEKYHVLAPNLINAGIKKLDASTYTIEQEEQLVLTMLGELGVSKANFVGLSVGGWISLRIALDRPDMMDRLVLIAPAGVKEKFPTAEQMGINQGDPISKWYGKLFYTPPPIPFFVLDTQSEYATTIHPKLAELLHVIQSRSQSLDKQLPEVRNPTLIIWGQDDRVLPPEWGHFLAEEIPGARLDIFPRCGHAVVWDQGELLQRTVLDFFADSEQSN